MTPAFLCMLVFSLIPFASLEPRRESELRIVHKLIGGHINANHNDDVELITSSAGEGQIKSKKGSTEEKKTLSQQVAEGKYALIQNELFSKPIKRPGIISYKDNPEVPKDNIRNLGGLNKSDIWLSENHLLVIKGGFYPDHNQENKDVVWKPIDNFNAPDRQVKIPSHPKVPPPFPVQLEEGGPVLLFLGPNVTKTLNGSFKEGIYPLYPENNEVLGEGGPGKEGPYSGKHPPYPFTGETPFPIPPFPPPAGLDVYNQDKPKGGVNNDSSPPYPPPFFPPADFPNIDNTTYDEDDPSIYYPPPYSFYYAKDNSTEVPPGPLVPGIVLPPPPNFFSSLEEKTNKQKESGEVTTTSTSTTTPKPTTTKPKVIETVAPTVAVRKKPPTTQITQRKKYPTVTILQPITRNTSTTKPPNKSISYRPTSSSETPRVIITKVPLKAYYATTYLEPVPQTEGPKIQNIPKSNIVHGQRIARPKIVSANRHTTTTTQAPPIQYYFYDDNVISTTPPPPPPPPIKIKEDNYYVPKHPQPPVTNIRYYYVGEPDYTNPPPIRHQNIRKPPQSQNTFSVHIARLRQEIQNYQNIRGGNDYANNNNNNYYGRPKPVYEYEFQAAGYKPQNYENQYVPQKRPLPHYNVEIQEAVEVTSPTPIYETTQEGYYLDSVTENPVKLRKAPQIPNYRTSKPVSQYSFEATQNPLFSNYYTKQDEKYIDDATKEYFTVFGKRLPVATTPLPAQRQKYYEPPQEPLKAQNPTLHGDTYVNYLPQRPRLNPHSEFILSPVNPERNYPQRIQQQSERPLVTYKLPGDEGTHFYFLTPQLAQKRDQNANFYFSNTKNGRR